MNIFVTKFSDNISIGLVDRQKVLVLLWDVEQKNDAIN